MLSRLRAAAYRRHIENRIRACPAEPAPGRAPCEATAGATTVDHLATGLLPASIALRDQIGRAPMTGLDHLVRCGRTTGERHLFGGCGIPGGIARAGDSASGSRAPVGERGD